MSSPTPKQTLAFFGATGGVCSTTLAHALRAGYHCTALARTPPKLLDLLRTAHDIPTDTTDKFLTIHAGDIKDAHAVAEVLKSRPNREKIVDTIIFGIGSYPKLQLSLLHPITIEDPTICEDGIKTIFRALDTLTSQNIASVSKPLFITLSATGLSPKTHDVPLLLSPLYHYALHIPILDKQRAETLLANDRKKHIRDCVIVRPTLMTDAPARGVEGLRVGWEWVGEERVRDGVEEVGPQVGWSVGRRDVGGFVWGVVREGGRGWEGRAVSLTY